MKDTKIFKKKLEEELALVETELKDIARKNPENPNDWEPVETEIDSDHADENDVADNQESFQENVSILKSLEVQYKEIKDALERIKNGTYGICEIGGKDDIIPEERLMANPSARNCIWHEKHPDDK